MPGGSWRNYAVTVGHGRVLLPGHFLGAALDFLILALLVYFTFTRLLHGVALSEDLEKKLCASTTTPL